MRNTRVRRRRLLDLRGVTLGDWIILLASILSVASLFMTWFETSVPRPHGEWAFTYSEGTSVAVIVLFLLTVFLIFYPVMAPQAGLPSLPFATPLVFLGIGALLLLVFTFELGRYDCIECQAISRGFGVGVAFFSAFIYIVGAIIKWGSRPVRPYAS
jgi:hypothetical protein